MMKTAKEILRIVRKRVILLKEDHIIAAMQVYAEQACKEQREICANGFVESKEIYYALLNAPQPQLL